MTWLYLAVTQKIDSLIIAYMFFFFYYEDIRNIVASQSIEISWKVKSLWQTVLTKYSCSVLHFLGFLGIKWLVLADGLWVTYVMSGLRWERFGVPFLFSLPLVAARCHETEAAQSDQKEESYSGGLTHVRDKSLLNYVTDISTWPSLSYYSAKLIWEKILKLTITGMRQIKTTSEVPFYPGHWKNNRKSERPN